MSIPLTHYYRNLRADKNKESNLLSSEIFLDADERYEVYEVKAAERPHLLEFEDFPSTSSKQPPKPIIDGCDIRGWRKESMVECSPTLQAVLNVGAFSTFFRRESQWPICDLSREKSIWHNIKMKLNEKSNIRKKADVINYEEYKKTVIVKAVKGSEIYQMGTKFAIEYEQKNIPAIIVGAAARWKCMPGNSSVSESKTDWTFLNLLSRFGQVYWRFSDTHGEMMSLATYAKYISNLEGVLDDSPLGIYDSEFGDKNSPTYELLEEYEIPSCFSPDLFNLVDDATHKERPPFRWILIGPQRSGTGMHVDPLWTNAWVTIIEGKKRWMLFPPNVPHEEIGMIEGMPQINSVVWFKSTMKKSLLTSGQKNGDLWKCCRSPERLYSYQTVGRTLYLILN